MSWKVLQSILETLEKQFPLKFSRLNAIVGLLMALLAILPASGVMFLILQVVEKENQANTQQTIGDTTRLVADHFRNEMTHFMNHLALVAKNQLEPIALKDLREIQTSGSRMSSDSGSPGKSSTEPVVSRIDTHPAILDVSLWKRGAPVSTFDLDAVPQRVVLGINERSSWIKLERKKQERISKEEAEQKSNAGPNIDEILGRIRAAQETEISPIQAAFHGNVVVILASSVFENQAGIFLAMPLESGTNPETVAVSHLSSEHFLRSIETHGMASIAWVDDYGHSLPQNILQEGWGDSYSRGSSSESMGKSSGDSPRFVNPRTLYNLLRTSRVANGQSVFKDEKGGNYFGGYSQIKLGRLGVLATLPESEADAVLKLLSHRAAFFMVSLFLLFFGVGYRLPAQSLNRFLGKGWASILDPGSGQQRGISEASAQLDAKDSQSLENEPKSADLSPSGSKNQSDPNQSDPGQTDQAEKKNVVVIHGSLKFVNLMMESDSATEVANLIRDFYSISAVTVREGGGLFLRYGATSFLGVWAENQGTQQESPAILAMRTAMSLRKNLFQYNQSRKNDGTRPLIFGMGMHTGIALISPLDHLGQAEQPILAGTVVDCSRALDHLVLEAKEAKSDLLISQDVWQQVEGQFVGEYRGDAKLTANTGMMGYYTIQGYQDENGQSVLVESNYQPEWEKILEKAPQEGTPESTKVISINPAAKKSRWLVNNGSQIIGPHLPEDIAKLLFGQELDFDCECWTEGGGQSSQIRDAGMFEGSEDSDANLWIYDGETIHGPISPGFLRTAIGHGAIQMETVLICENSTVNGWKRLEDWNPNLFSSLARNQEKVAV